MLKTILKSGIKGKSIALKFALYILIFSSIITLLATSLQLYLDYSKDRQLLEARILDIKNSYIHSIEASIWLTNEKLLMIQLQGIYQLPDMQYVAVHINDKHTLPTGEKGIYNSPDIQNLIVHLDDEHIHSIGEINGNYLLEKQFPLNYSYRGKNIFLGTLQIVVTLEEIYNRLIDRVWIILASQAIKTFLVSFFILLLFYLLVGRHLYTLAGYARSLNFEHLNNPAKLERKKNGTDDELDLLEHSLNTMQANLKDSYQLMEAEISRRKKAELVLKESEQRYRELFNNISDGVAIYEISDDGKDFIFRDHNHAGETINNIPHDQVIGKGVRELFPGVDTLGLFDILKRVWHTGKAEHLPAKMYQDERIKLWVENYVFRLQNGEIVAVYKDLTEKKRAEEALKKSVERFNLAMQGTNDGLWDWDLQTNQVYYSVHWKSMLGYSEKELENKLETWEQLLHPNDLEIAKHIVDDYLSGKISKYEVEFRMQHKKGHWLDILARGFTVHDKLSGEPIRFIGTHVDISKRKQIEEKLKASEKKFRAVFNQAAVGVARVAPDGKWQEVNNKLCNITGYSQQELLGKTFQDITHPDDLQTDLKYVSQMLKDEIQIYSMEKRYIHKNGAIIWINLTVSLVRDNNNIPDYFISIIEDISKKKQREEELKHQHLITKTITDNAASSLFMMNAQGYPTFMNPAAEKVTGYTLDKIKHKPLHESIHYKHPDGSPYPMSECPFGDAQSELTEMKNCEGVFIREDGTFYPVMCYLAPLALDGKLIGSVLEFQDITERKQSEEQIRKISLAVEQSPESIIITNTKAEIEYVNESFLRTTGYSYEEVIGQNPRILQSGKTPQKTYADMWSSLTSGKPWKGEFHNRHKDGREYIEFALITPLRQADGHISHYVAIKEDITEKKMIAKELDQYRLHLEELVSLRTKELTTAQQHAETANQAKSAFIANMSHEIRTPMNAILGLTHLLQKSEQDSSQLTRLSKISTAGEHLLSLLNDILDLSKIEADKLELETSNFSLNILFNSIQVLLNEQFLKKGLIFEIAPFDFSPWLVGDATRLRQALLNYLSNAIKFTPSGKVTLRVKKLKEQDNHLLLQFEVQDTGIGIDADKLKRLFEKFEQADTSTTRQFGGTGLGLSISKRLAKLMGGDVGVHSEPNQGSTFYFSGWFSYGKEDATLSTDVSTKEQEISLNTHYAGSHVLLVEDNTINLEVAQDLLSSVGLVVDTAINGRQAVEKVKTHRYDLILMDIQMPVMDGLEATRQIKAIEEKANLPILAMTAGVLDNEKHDCIAAGMNDFVAKPIELHDFYSSLIKWLPEHLIAHKMPSESESAVLQVEPETASTSLLKEQLDDIEGLDTSIGLSNLRGDSKAYLRLLQLFDSSHAEDIDKFKQYLSENKVHQEIQLAHTIKGAAGTLGLIQLQKTSSLLETSLKSASEKEVAQLVDSLTTLYNNFHHALLNIDDNSVVEPVLETLSEESLSEARAILKKLEELLKQDDSSVNTLFLESKQLLQQAYGSKVKKMGQQIETFNYPEALLTVQSFLKNL